MSFRFHPETKQDTPCVSYVHHPNSTSVKPPVEDSIPVVKLVEPEEVKSSVPAFNFKVTAPAPCLTSNTVINHHVEVVPLGLEHNVAPTLGLQIARTPSPAPVPVENSGVVMRIKRREKK